MTAFLTWLFGTKTGRAVFTAAIIAACWWGFSTHYYNNGVKDCQSQRSTDTNAANVAQGEKNIASNQTSSAIEKKSDADAARVASEAEGANNQSKETVREVYRNPPATAPVAVGSCVHPLDQRVQDRISSARAAAVEARGPAR